MKGHMQDGKFHPHTEYKKGTRKSRDQSTKSEGVKIRKARNQDLVYAESYNRGQNIKVVGHGDDWMLLVDRNVVGRATTQQEIFEMYDKVNVHPETGSPHFFDPRSPRSFKERKKRFVTEDDIDRKSNLEINALFKDVKKRWEERRGDTNLEGDGFYMIFRNKKSPEYTFEIHPITDTIEADPPDHPEDEEFDAWYWFPAKNGKATWNSPTTLSATGGYTQKDAIREFKKEFIIYDQEFHS